MIGGKSHSTLLGVMRRVRIVVATYLIEMAWALRSLCQSCAKSFLGAARRLAPEAERYFTRHFKA